MESPTLYLQLEPGVELSIAVTGPQADVTGFRVPVAHLSTQEDADALSQQFQTLYDALPDSQKRLMAALVGQAADYADQVWSAGSEKA
jgi:hypothetical protein